VYHTSKVIRYWKSKPFIPDTFRFGWSPPHPTFYVLRETYKRLGNFNLDYSIASDIELMMRYLEVNRIKYKYFPEILVRMRLGGTTNKSVVNIWRQNQQILNALKIHKLRTNRLLFFIYKFNSRFKQFLQKNIYE